MNVFPSIKKRPENIFSTFHIDLPFRSFNLHFILLTKRTPAMINPSSQELEKKDTLLRGQTTDRLRIPRTGNVLARSGDNDDRANRQRV